MWKRLFSLGICGDEQCDFKVFDAGGRKDLEKGFQGKEGRDSEPDGGSG